jgi:Na+/H+ antiporter NhaD/arsenite permease-like protein
VGGLSPQVTLVAAWVIFAASYLVFAFGRMPGTRLDRTAMAVIGGVLMVAFGVLTPQRAIASVEFGTLVLLFSMMLIVAGLHLSGFFDRLVRFIAERLHGRHLLPAIIFSSGILSAFLINDVVCIFMAPLVLRLSRHYKQSTFILMMALATASNIGSVATITGNPQNILIGTLSGIGYRHFLWRLGPPALLGLFADWALLEWFSRRRQGRLEAPREEVTEFQNNHPPQSHLVWPLLVTGCVTAGFLAGFAPALVASLGAAVMLLGPHIDRQKYFEEVDWSLLVLFAGLFLVVGGAEVAGIAGTLLSVAERLNLHNPVLLGLSVTGLSNVVSNVPAVMLLKNLPAQTVDPQRTWLLLSLTSTLAGNLTITGSVANIIVVEKAREEAPISFWDYARVGVPVTVVTMGIGVLWLLMT